MNRINWIILFIVALLANIAAGLVKNELLDYFSKPLIIVAVVGYFLAGVTGTPSKLKKWILLALLFSWIGDIFLMFQQGNSNFFLFGLCSFLIAHIFYIIFFHRVRLIEGVKGRIWLALIVVIYYTALIVLLSPRLGDMKTPVRIYGIVISLMFMLALHMLFIKQRSAGIWMMIGALLFIASDSILAINRFYQSFEPAGILIMLSYGLAQLSIAHGSGRYISLASKE